MTEGQGGRGSQEGGGGGDGGGRGEGEGIDTVDDVFADNFRKHSYRGD